MMVLKNIEKHEHVIEADYFSEGTGPMGHMAVAMPEEKIIKHVKVGAYGHSHVFFALVKMFNLKNVPTEKTILWY